MICEYCKKEFEPSDYEKPEIFCCEECAIKWYQDFVVKPECS